MTSPMLILESVADKKDWDFSKRCGFERTKSLTKISKAFLFETDMLNRATRVALFSSILSLTFGVQYNRACSPG